MKDEDVGVAVKGDDLGFELVAQSGLDGEQATYGEVLCVVVGGGGGRGVTIHGHLVTAAHSSMPKKPESVLFGFLIFGLVLVSKMGRYFFKVQFNYKWNVGLLQSQLFVSTIFITTLDIR